MSLLGSSLVGIGRRSCLRQFSALSSKSGSTRVSTPMPSLASPLSTSSAPSSSSSLYSIKSKEEQQKEALQFVIERKRINKEINLARKQWNTDHKEKMRLSNLQKQEERRRIVLEKAQRERVKKEQSLKRQAADKERKASFKRRFEEHLARNILKYQKKVEKQQERYDLYLKDLNEESKHWITNENLDEKISPNLFKTPSTTGLAMSQSEHWRWHVMSINLNRLMSKEYIRERQTQKEQDGLSLRLDFAASAESIKKFEVRDFLEEMVGTGRDREHLEELVDKFTSELDHHGAFNDDSFQWYFDLMLEKATRDHKNNPLTKWPGAEPQGNPEYVARALAKEQKFIAEEFNYPPELDEKGEPVYEEMPYVEDPDDENIILPQRDPNERKLLRGKPINVKKATKKKKK